MLGFASLIPLVLAGVALASPLMAAEGKAKILAPWEANGQLFQVAVDKLQFIGTFEGIMYIEHGEGLLDAALFTCPSTQITEVLTNQIKAHGYCTIESPSGDYIYAETASEGEPGACADVFTLTGGTGKLTGITGQSDLIVRTALSGTTIDQQSRGAGFRRQGPGDLARDALRGSGQVGGSHGTPGRGPRRLHRPQEAPGAQGVERVRKRRGGRCPPLPPLPPAPPRPAPRPAILVGI